MRRFVGARRNSSKFFGGFQRLPKGSYAFSHWLWYVFVGAGFPSP